MLICYSGSNSLHWASFGQIYRNSALNNLAQKELGFREAEKKMFSQLKKWGPTGRGVLGGSRGARKSRVVSFDSVQQAGVNGAGR